MGTNWLFHPSFGEDEGKRKFWPSMETATSPRIVNKTAFPADRRLPSLPAHDKAARAQPNHRRTYIPREILLAVRAWAVKGVVPS
jgi:hypothetical protein